LLLSANETFVGGLAGSVASNVSKAALPFSTLGSLASGLLLLHVVESRSRFRYGSW
jgi:hypothetical protein